MIISCGHYQLLVQSVLLLIVFLLSCQPGSPIECLVGYGQRGKLYSNGMQWHRQCPGTEYCFEVVTEDVNKMKKLIDFPWDPYFFEFYIQSCGGDYNTTAHWHPYRETLAKYGRPMYRKVRANSRLIQVNITMPISITGEGGTELFSLNYICRDSLCSSATRYTSSLLAVSLTAVLGVLLSTIYA